MQSIFSLNKWILKKNEWNFFDQKIIKKDVSWNFLLLKKNEDGDWDTGEIKRMAKASNVNLSTYLINPQYDLNFFLSIKVRS